jgi:hypothetical protein
MKLSGLEGAVPRCPVEINTRKVSLLRGAVMVGHSFKK